MKSKKIETNLSSPLRQRLVGFLQFCQKHWFAISFCMILILAIFVRFYKVTSFPPSLYDEEIALGYDAYSILKTGKDHLGNPAPLVAFESYGDYKPALYFYLLVPSIAVFGLTDLAVRIPAMIAGVLIVIGVGVIARLITRRRISQVLAMMGTSISPWAILFSRAGWESNVATCFIVWAVACGFGVYLWQPQKFLAQKLQSLLPIVSFLFFGLSMYTYHSARVVAPILALLMLFFWLVEKIGLPNKFSEVGKKLWQQKTTLFKYFVFGVFFLIIITPILLALTDKTTQERLAETNIFADGHVVKESNYYEALAHHALWARIFYHRYIFYTADFIQNYLLHFSFDFLFVHGDHNLRHSVQYFGELYLIESVFLFLGLVFIFKHWKKEYAYLLCWLFVAILPAALTNATPHALRILSAMPVFLLVISFGIMESIVFAQQIFTPLLSKKLSLKIPVIVLTVICIFYAIEFVAFWHFYSIVYPKLYSGGWQYGYKQIVAEVNKRKSEEKTIYFTRELDRPAMAYWFFSKTDPREVQKIDKVAQRDQGEQLQFENISFINFINDTRPNSLVVSSLESYNRIQENGSHVSKQTEIKDPNGKTIWMVYHLD